MATKRSVDTIYSDTLPQKSKDEYKNAWSVFLKFTDHEEKPTETDFVQYIDYLHTEKKYAASTVWKVYSMLNHMYQHNYSTKLQEFPKLTQLIKSFCATIHAKWQKPSVERKCMLSYQ